MAKIKKMMELEENGDERQFFPQTHADAVLDLHDYLKKYVITRSGQWQGRQRRYERVKRI